MTLQCLNLVMDFFATRAYSQLSSSSNNNSCLSQCGSVVVPYPFGTAPGCGLPEFQLSCIGSNSSDTPIANTSSWSFSVDPVLLLSIPSGDFQVTVISNNNLCLNTTSVKALACSGSTNLGHAEFNLAPPPSPYVLTDQNVFFGAGCNATVNVTFDGSGNSEQTCKTGCNKPVGYPYPYCDNCCTIPVPQGTRTVDFYGGVLGNNAAAADQAGTSSCGFSTFLQKNSYTPAVVSGGDGGNGSVAGQQELPSNATLGSGHWVAALEWAIPGPSCVDAITLNNYSLCAPNATCTASNTTGYKCACPRGFYGNAYNLSGMGCQDINECHNAMNSCAPNAICINMPGSYNCSCYGGYSGDGFGNGTGCTAQKSHNQNIPLIAAILTGLGGGLLTLFCFKRGKKRNQFTRRNIEALGNMKDFLLASSDGESTTTLFSFRELEKATNRFADEHKVGTGGHGTVYKGMLETGLTVAVKKTNHVDISGSQQFLNEVLVLSQVNHRNLVKLHGCCLETEIPILVYEFVPNGNLSEHLRGEKPGTHLNWAKRMQIAIETAEAISYLHSAASPPIYHRDVKSANILLDHTFGVKVSDFGISRLMNQPDATHVSTAVQGTPGYLDPEYFHSYHLTEKSDVYSFGVILLELVTSKYPLDFNREEKEVNLTAMCVPQIKKGNVDAIVDPKLLNAEDYAETRHEIEGVANLATHCLAAQRDDRPCMKQVTEELHHIKGNKEGHSSMIDRITEQKFPFDSKLPKRLFIAPPPGRPASARRRRRRRRRRRCCGSQILLNISSQM
ncbi:unnamed protein product [Sphagnum jensenii]|uniref:Protein kinase domain-containing protein n=1 Tax=Sphagnum jensenii TaxID=128206 RepID=A0ABP0WJZ0_9BRYO